MSVIDGTSFGLDEDSWEVPDCQKIIDSYALDGVDVDIQVQNTGFEVFVDGVDLETFIEAFDEIIPAIEDYFDAKHESLLDDISAVTTYTDEF